MYLSAVIVAFMSLLTVLIVELLMHVYPSTASTKSTVLKFSCRRL